MRVLHISTTDGPGGAGLAALRLHQSLLDRGVESKMLVAQKSTALDSVIVAKMSTINKYIPPKNPIVRFLRVTLRKIGIGVSQFEKDKKKIYELQKQYPAYFTFSVSSYEIENHQLIEWADIIHLHWIQDFVNYKTFFHKVKKPIVWTFHDMNPLFGGFHHYRLREKYYQYYKVIEDRQYEIKKSSLLRKRNLHIVAISSMMENLISNNNIYACMPIHRIFNIVDESKFSPIDKNVARKKLNLCPNKTIYLFVCRWINDGEKGLNEAIEALEKLCDENTLMLCVGEGDIKYEGPLNILHYEATIDHTTLSLYYSAADCLLFTSFQEAFSQVPLESMSCGTPVIMTPVSGATDLINDSNGIISKDFAIDSIVNAIKKAKDMHYDSKKIRNEIVTRFTPSIIASEYIDLYNSVLD